MGEYVFHLQAVEDGEVTYSRKYRSAVEAVRDYDLFRDSGTARYRREIVLVEPSGQSHAKVFDVPQLAVIR